MVTLDTAMPTLKDKITSNENLSVRAEGQFCTNKLAIQGLTMDLGYMRTDLDLHKDRLDDYFGQIDTARITQQEQGGKLVELESTQDRLLAEVQALREELQQEREKNQEPGRQLQVVCPGGWSRQVNE